MLKNLIQNNTNRLLQPPNTNEVVAIMLRKLRPFVCLCLNMLCLCYPLRNVTNKIKRTRYSIFEKQAWPSPPVDKQMTFLHWNLLLAS